MGVSSDERLSIEYDKLIKKVERECTPCKNTGDHRSEDGREDRLRDHPGSQEGQRFWLGHPFRHGRHRGPDPPGLCHRPLPLESDAGKETDGGDRGLQDASGLSGKDAGRSQADSNRSSSPFRTSSSIFRRSPRWISIPSPFLKERPMPSMQGSSSIKTISKRTIPSQYPHLVITPYPTRYVTSWRLPDGTEVTLRPIKPEDEPLGYELLTSLSPQTFKERFFQNTMKITHEMLIRLCNIDYDREVALVAEVREGSKRRFIGIGTLDIDPILETENSQSSSTMTIRERAWAINSSTRSSALPRKKGLRSFSESCSRTTKR